MLLSELAEVTGMSAASIKFYRREGLLPAGARLTTTRQDYGQSHVERLHLIHLVREETGASIAQLRLLCSALDDPTRPLVDALENAQSLATGIDVTASQPERQEDALIGELMAELGWPDVVSGPRLALAELLAQWRGSGFPVRKDVLLRYGRALNALAREDVEALGESAVVHGTRDPDAVDEAPSRDVAVTRAVRGMVSYDRLTRVLRALGHASYSVLRAESNRPAGSRPDGAEPVNG